MKILKFQNRDEWLQGRLGKITGSKLKDIIVKRGTGKKIGFYELIAERVAIPADGEDPMERGTRLEGEALDLLEKATDKKFNRDLVIWTRDDDEDIAISPDGFRGVTEAAEAKCLSSARYLEALITQKVPDDYEFQKLQYFIVNDRLKTLYFAFYDPRIPAKPFFYLTFHRKDLEDQIQEFLAYQKSILREVEKITNELTF